MNKNLGDDVHMMLLKIMLEKNCSPKYQIYFCIGSDQKYVLYLKYI